MLRSACLVLACLQASFAQSSQLVIHSDADCRLRVDGTERGTLKTGNELRLALAAGEHNLEAVQVAGDGHWQKTVRLDAPDEHRTVAITLHPEATRAEMERRGYWVNPETQQTWTSADNASGISFSQAQRYCQALTLGGFKDWTLPSIDDLQQLFGGPENERGYHVKGPIKMTGWQWSSTAGEQEGEGWALDFGDGGRASVAAGDSGLNRALCVRHVSSK